MQVYPQLANDTGQRRLSRSSYMMTVCPMEATVSFKLGTREVAFTTTMLPCNSKKTPVVIEHFARHLRGGGGVGGGEGVSMVRN